MSGITEITVGEQQTDQHTFKITNFKKFMKVGEEVRSSFIEMFPPSRKKIAFIVKPFSNESATRYRFRGGCWTSITDNDKFFCLQLSPRGSDSPRLAGSVEIKLGESKQTINLGDPQEEKYEKFSCGSLVIRPGILTNFRDGAGDVILTTDSPNMIHVKLSGAEEESLELKFSLFCPGEVINVQVQEKALPDSLKTSGYLKKLTKAVMEDKSTTDLMITCGDKEKKKTFHVHKSFFCAGSPVFRAAVESDMLEKKTSEIYIEVFYCYTSCSVFPINICF